MAGTTVNEHNVVYKSLHAAIREAEYNRTLSQVLAVGAGKEKRQAIRDVLDLDGKTHSDREVDSIHKSFLSILEKAYDKLEVSPQEGAEEIFRYLKDHDVFVVLNTGYDLKTAESLIDKLHWKKGVHFDELITADQVENSRPEPDMIHLAQKKLGVPDSRQVAKIGDAAIDVEEGKNAGCSCTVGVTTGAHTAEQLRKAGPDYVIDELEELKEILEVIES